MNKRFQSIHILGIYLFILSLAASIFWHQTDLLGYVTSLLHMFLLWGSGFLVYRTLLHFQKISPTRFEHRSITVCILFLLFDPLNAWWVFLLVGTATEVLQRVVRSLAGPIFNPAALGALVVSLLGFYPSWWGVNFAPRLPLLPGGVSSAVLLTLPVGIYVASQYRKLWIVVPTLLATALSYAIVFQKSPLFLVVEGTLLFFALVMVLEPKTSPVVKQDQLVFGSIVGLLLPLLLSIGFWEAYAGALLVANAWWYYKRFWHARVLAAVVPGKTGTL